MPFWRRAQLSPPNAPSDWKRADIWLRWPPPRNVVVGESHYLPALTKLAGPPCEDGYCLPAEVKLVREPSNPHDANAIRAEVEGQVIGYLARQVAAQLAPPLDRGGCRSFGVCGVIRGGSYDAPNLGVHIWLEMLTTPGPEIGLTGDFAEVSWPPRGKEAFPLRGRTNSALTDAELDVQRIRGVHYTCLKDESSCPACRAADDDRLRRLDDPVRLANRPPHPDCTSVEDCRCMEFYVLVDENPPSQGWNWSNESLELNRLDDGEEADRG